MLNKVSGLARTLYVVLAIVAGFVALGGMGMDVALVLLVLGLIAGISIPDDRVVLAAATVIALPIIGTALTHIPTIGAQPRHAAASGKKPAVPRRMADAFCQGILISCCEGPFVRRGLCFCTKATGSARTFTLTRSIHYPWAK